MYNALFDQQDNLLNKDVDCLIERIRSFVLSSEKSQYCAENSTSMNEWEKNIMKIVSSDTSIKDDNTD